MSFTVTYEPLEGVDFFDILLDTNGPLFWESDILDFSTDSLVFYSIIRTILVQDRHVDMSIRPRQFASSDKSDSLNLFSNGSGQVLL